MILKLKIRKFYHHKRPIFLEDVDIEKGLVSNKISSDEKNCTQKFFRPRLLGGSKTLCFCNIKARDEMIKTEPSQITINHFSDNIFTFISLQGEK